MSLYAFDCMIPGYGSTSSGIPEAIDDRHLCRLDSTRVVFLRIFRVPIPSSLVTHVQGFMSTQIILPPPPHPPSPSKTNPFARPLIKHHPSSFTRQTLLPNVSPVKQTSSVSAVDNGISTPTDNARKPKDGTDSGSVGRGRQGWRLLWRGGLEIGEEGWRLEGELLVSGMPCSDLTRSAL